MRRTGPEKFWDARRMSRGFMACLLVSALLHYLVGPFSLVPRRLFLPPALPEPESSEGIAVELLDENKPPPTSELAVEPATESFPSLGPASPPASPDKGPGDVPGGAGDAGTSGDAAADARDLPRDGGSDAPLVALHDAASDAPIEPGALVGSIASNLQKPTHTLVLNTAPIRQHPSGPALSQLLSKMPEWRQFMGPNFDVVSQIDWLLISGPGLWTSTQNTSVLLRYSAPHAAIEEALKIATKGKVYPTGAPGLRGYAGMAHGAERVFLWKPSEQGLAVLPRETAKSETPRIAKAKFPATPARIGASTAAYYKYRVTPFGRDRILDISQGCFPATTELVEVWVHLRPDHTLDVEALLETPDSGAAMAANQHMRTCLSVVLLGASFFADDNTIPKGLRGALATASFTARDKSVRLSFRVTAAQLADVSAWAMRRVGAKR